MRARIEKVNVLGWSKSYEFWEIWVIILLDFLLVTGGTKMWNLNIDDIVGAQNMGSV